MARPSSTAWSAAQTICASCAPAKYSAEVIGGGSLASRLGAILSRTMWLRLFAAGVALLPALAMAGHDEVQAGSRDNATNFKDMALAACVAAAYNGSAAGKDASITTSVFLDWTYYDIEKEAGAVDALVHKYLARDYSNPFEGYEHAKFDMLKCIDMYHSRELNDLVRKYVLHPTWIGDKPRQRKNASADGK